MNHLIYFTFGEQSGSVYATQVKQLLNHWSRREDWKVTLIQIADEENFTELDPTVDRIYVKRKFKFLLPFQKSDYNSQIRKLLNIDLSDKLYFTSRGSSAFLLASYFIDNQKLNVKCNNLDVRGTIEEYKLSKSRRLLYPYIRYRLRKVLHKTTSVTTVTSNLKEHLQEDYDIKNPKLKINVNPTLSILSYSHHENKKDIAFIGKIAWIKPEQFVEQIKKINNLFSQQGWSISLIGNSSGTFGLVEEGIKIVERMTPLELEEYIKRYHSGIVLRDASIINKVAAPCKISDYLCLGMPVIYSGEIGSLKDFIDKYPQCSKYIVHVNEINNIDKVIDHINIKQQELSELAQIAQGYFGVNAVIDRYISIFNS